MDIGKLIRSRRIELGITQKDIAIHVGVSEGTVSRWESGNIGNMRRDRIAKLANILRVSPTVVMGIEDSEEWLRYGTGEKYIENTESILQQLGKEYSLDSDTVTLVRSIVEAAPEQRQSIVNFVETTAEKLRNARIKEAELKKQAETLNHDRPAGLSDDEWELVKNVRLEKSTATSSAFRSGKEA